MLDVFVDGGDQLGHTGKHTAAHTFHRDVAKEALDRVQPRGRGRREVHVNARSFSKPPLHSGMFVGGVIVGNQMQLLLGRRLTFDLAQEPQRRLASQRPYRGAPRIADSAYWRRSQGLRRKTFYIFDAAHLRSKWATRLLLRSGIVDPWG
jgi:hypothetical protein